MINNVDLKEFRYQEDKPITIEVINNFINRHKAERYPVFIENDNLLKQYNLPIDTEYSNNENFSGVKIKNNVANVIANTHFSYFMGADIQYTAQKKDERALKKYQDFVVENKGNEKDKDIAIMMGRYGVAYELMYQDGKNVETSVVSPLEAFVVYDYSIKKKPLFGVRYYTVSNDEKIVEVYTRRNIIIYEVNTNGEVLNTMNKDNLFLDCNLIEYKNNDFMFADFQNVKTYIEDINKTLSSESNLIHYMNDALMVFVNLDVDVEAFERLKSNKVLLINNTSDTKASEAYFLEKPINVEGFKTHLLNIYENAFKESFTPLLSGRELAQAPSGKALQIMYLNADLVANVKQKFITEGIDRRLKLFFNLENINKVVPLTYSSIVPEFTRNLPTFVGAELEDLRTLTSIGARISNKTLLEKIPTKYINDIERELERIDEEDKQLMEKGIIQEQTNAADGFKTNINKSTARRKAGDTTQ